MSVEPFRSSALDRARLRAEALLRGERLAVANRYCAYAAAALAAAVVAWALAAIARVVSADRGVAPQVAAVRSPPPTLGRDYASLAEAHLFGQAQAPAASAPLVEPAPDTDLPLTLTGVLVVDGAGPSAAIVASSDADERTYEIGDVIAGAGTASLHAVYADRVVLARDGALETLRLRRDASLPVVVHDAAAEPLAEAEPTGLSEDELAVANAVRAAEVLQVTPDYAEDRFVGFRVASGNDRVSFERSGLRTGDVITSVNGEPLADPGGAAEMLDVLATAVTASVAVTRNGASQHVVVNLSSVASLAR